MATKDLVLSCISKSKILKWYIKEGESVKKDQVLATYIYMEKVDSDYIIQRKLKAKVNGKIIEVAVKPNNEILKGVVVARMKEEQCQHDVIMKDMCCGCGADLRKEAGVPGDLIEPTTASEPVVHNIHELRVSVEEAQRLAKQDQKQLLKARKLVLVVDLDMTLIHTTVQPVPKNTKDVYSFRLKGHQYEYHTKLRPDARNFLENISKYYELHIFTMGSRMYAHTIAKMLDPDGKHFAHRIRSRDEFINSFSKFHDLKALFPCGDHMVCIIDDREDVWNFAPNLIMVKPYRYFKGSDDINDPFKPSNGAATDTAGKIPTSEPTPLVSNGNEAPTDDSNSEKREVKPNHTDIAKEDDNDESKGSVVNDEQINKAEVKTENTVANNSNDANELHKDTDDYLYFLGKILERIHAAFYTTLDLVKEKGGLAEKDPQISRYCSFATVNPDVRVIAPELKRQTLKGSNIVFTGVVPTNVPLEKSRPWRTAIALGARVTSDIVTPKNNGKEGESATTHVVAARHGTQKSYKASKSPNIRLVNPNWLWCAGERWEWPEEAVFPVPLSEGKSSPGNSRQGTPQHNPFETASKSRKQMSPLAQEDFEIPGGYNPDRILDSVNPLGSFSKSELDKMDKEVEELMQSENESSDGDGNESSDDNEKDDENSTRPSSVLASSNGKKRKHNASGNTSSGGEDHPDDSNLTSTKSNEKGQRKKAKITTTTKNNEPDSSSSNDEGTSSDSSDDDGQNNSSGSGSSSDSSDSSGESDGEEDGDLLARKISES